MNVAQHKIVNLLKTFFYFFCSSVCVSVCIFNVWPKTTILPLWPRDAKRLDTPARDTKLQGAVSVGQEIFNGKLGCEFFVIIPRRVKK